MNEFDRLHALSKRLKETYKPGMRIELNHMGSDPYPIPDGSRGTVIGIDDIGSIMIKWDSGRSLSLIYGEDSFRVLTPEEAYAEAYSKKNREFIEKMNTKLLPKVSLEKLKMFQDAGDTWYVKAILKTMHDIFCETFGGDYVNEDMEYVTVPAVIKGANGKIYPGLVDLDVSSSGEHYGSGILTPIGMIEHDGSGLSENQAKLLSEIIPYQYWYTPYIERNHHVDFDDLPADVEEILSYATGEDYFQSGGIDY